MKITYIILIPLFLLFASCGNKERIKGVNGEMGALGDSGQNGQGKDLPMTDLGFAEVFEKVIGPNCMLCHSKRKYDEYEVVKLDAVKMLNQIITDQMPVDFSDQPDPLPQDLKDLFQEWVEAGAPEFGSL